jgi:hypothetical protein
MLSAHTLSSSPVLLSLLFALASLSPAAFSEQVQLRYGERDVAGLRALCATPPTDEAAWLCRYRLYPLTQDARLLDDLPADAAPGASAQTLALQAGLWGYKTVGASVFELPGIGRKAERLLGAARTRQADDPYVLLIEGQSLFYKPAIVGGDKRRALETFERLRGVVERRPHAGVSAVEADVWVWYARHMTEPDRAEAERRRLLAGNLPPLWRAFLLSPP